MNSAVRIAAVLAAAAVVGVGSQDDQESIRNSTAKIQLRYSSWDLKDYSNRSYLKTEALKMDVLFGVGRNI